jgi:PadR family transcriptional regulator PadR
VANGESSGEFQSLVWPAVLRLDADAYGVRGRREIAERTARDVTIGAVYATLDCIAVYATADRLAAYATLDRLVAKGPVVGVMSDPTPERGGRAKRWVPSYGRSDRGRERRAQGIYRSLRGADRRADKRADRA